MVYLFLQNNYTYYNQENMVLRTMRKFYGLGSSNENSKLSSVHK